MFDENFDPEEVRALFDQLESLSPFDPEFDLTLDAIAAYDRRVADGLRPTLEAIRNLPTAAIRSYPPNEFCRPIVESL